YFGPHSAGIIKAAVGMGGFEINVSNYRTSSFDMSRLIRDDATSFGFSCQLLPETPVTPSFSVGAKDVTNKLRAGTTFYGAFSKDFAFIDRSGTFTKLYVTAGAGTETLKKAFGSVSCEIRDRVYADFEMYDGGSSYGAGIKLNDMFRAGYLRFNDTDYGGLRFSLEF
ncbi:MAG: YjbH domain-containing protein, partial [Abditibacteriota bacterium]|nr:YjbH domain-containing protein [Abditibacteriota bacterium]